MEKCKRLGNYVVEMKGEDMQEVFSRIIEELEIERTTANNTFVKYEMNVDLGRVFGLEKAIEIIKQEAKEYNNGHFGCNTNGEHEKCNGCGLTDCKNRNKIWFGVRDDNNGWIPCSEKLPELRQDVLVTVKYTGFMGMHGYWIQTGHMEAENDWWEIAQAVKSLHGNHYHSHINRRESESMSHIETLIMNEVRKALESLERSGVGYIAYETTGVIHYNIDQKDISISVGEPKGE